MAITREQVLQALATVTLGEGGASLASSGRLSEILIDPTGRVMFSIAVDPSEAAAAEPARLAAEAAIRKLSGVSGVFASLTADRPAAKGPATSPSPAPGRPAHAPSPRAQIIPGVKHVIAVASGKGGVGKSTTACNLALALLAQGLKIGVLDADIYGPSMPKLFGLHGKPRVVSGRILEPLDGYGVKVMSIGFMVEEETP
ncbi:MAG TPA: P-loop NTPase, partial [Beijerinckiaceae bacterium]|nr:P-loop NTPase [Beijerinckiaceae bacterium]